MVAQADKRLLWHPRGQNKFVVGGSSQITLYEWLPQSSQIKQVASQMELNAMKCFAWSPDAVLDDLIAVGFSNGRVDLLRLEASKHAANGVLSNGPAVSLQARNTRACNALAFSSADPSYLAVGLDKVRNDPSLLIWDIQSAAPMLSINAGSYVPPSSRPLPHLPRTDSSSRPSDPRIVQQHAPVENVSSLAWLPHSSSLLLAGVSHRWLQLFDLRNTSSGPAKAACKVQGIATDPFDAHRVACFGDGIVSIWDIRRFSQPVLTFTAKDASADGANGIAANNTGVRGKATSASGSATNLAHVEFSSTRRGTLATLERDADYVRFWDIVQAQFVEVAQESSRSRDSSQSGNRAARTSWVKSWSAAGSTPSHSSPPPQAPPNEATQYNLILADTRRTKTFSRSFASFALVPSEKPHPLTSNVMLVNKDGDLELYAVHDTPVHPVWSSRGDLALGIGCSYAVIPGITDTTPPPEPWDILAAYPSRPGSHAQSLERPDLASDMSRMRLRSESPARSMPPATFGRGDEDGFPALSPSPARPTADEAASRAARRRMHSPAPFKPPRFEHTASSKVHPPWGNLQGRKHRSEQEVPLAIHQHVSMHTPKTVTLALDDEELRAKPSRKSSALRALQHVVETDISMVMRKRAIRGYGLVNPLHNSVVVRETSPDAHALSELWLWVDHAQRLLSTPSPMIDGYNFAYQGLSGIWDGFRATRHQPPSNQPTPRMYPRGTLFDGPSASPLLAPLTLDAPRRSNSKHSGGRKRSRPPGPAFPEDFLAAIEILNARSGSSDSITTWKPSVSTARLGQRRFALQLCGWSLAQEDLARAIKRWEKDNKHSQAACWLVFTEQNKQAIDVLMRSKDESHHMMSGMLAALTSGGPRNPELIQHCERLIVRLQDPYLRALLTHLTVRDWTEVLEEDSLPLRERLAIAMQFLDDKDVSAYLRRVSDRCIHDGDIDGIVVTGLSNSGIDLLQTYLDVTGDVQSVALLATLPPSRAQDPRALRWLNAYRDMLDGWRLFHHRCQLDIDRGRILREAIENAEIRPLDWAPKQLLLRCNYCNKPMDPPYSADGHLRATQCPHCSRPLPRCSVCLMTLSLVPDSSRGSSILSSIPSGMSAPL
ncbi:hypothetical protein PYCCODRAFT_1419471 [Trametes coccinea BRFM310]|uniref:MIOS-like alpha-solenoid domain-containing protein n=1 Tax=Trametes coccinea (strain BRFM310) TaxID=1353009 RepID=A0A1Y2IC11_TRAC3|nr:hypothetical protein PYCCODRAFT_1419471 [Trametes coccinea BRFM310]